MYVTQVSPYHMLPGVEWEQSCRLGLWDCLDSIPSHPPTPHPPTATPAPFLRIWKSSRVSSPQSELIK